MRTFEQYLQERDPEMLDEMNKYVAGGLAAGALALGGEKAAAQGASTADQIAAISQQVDQAQNVQDSWQQLQLDLDSGKVKLDFKNPVHRHFVTYNPKYHPSWIKGGDNTELLRQLDDQKKMTVTMRDAQNKINPQDLSGLAAKLRAKLDADKAGEKGAPTSSSPSSMGAAQHFLKYAK